jgi:hypothetical protein
MRETTLYAMVMEDAKLFDQDRPNMQMQRIAKDCQWLGKAKIRSVLNRILG